MAPLAIDDDDDAGGPTAAAVDEGVDEGPGRTVAAAGRTAAAAAEGVAACHQPGGGSQVR